MKAAWMHTSEKPIIAAIMVLTKNEIKNFQQYLSLLSEPTVPDDIKQDVAVSANKLQLALKKVKEDFPAKNFEISFSHFFNNTPCYVLGQQYFLDKSRIVRINKHFILKLSEYLYPELYILGDKQ
ncbi:hypothetical protein [Chakrabartyella piscis]|uniref:hypothetical protein n=1 Tax=Chakrabartyella piscis TaxID=2918914 RepID=UPI002958AD6A|nr:hypothetical protein [Chakrabartyella piscis]